MFSQKSKKSLLKRLDQVGSVRIIIALLVICSLVFIGFKVVHSHALSNDAAVKSGIAGYCLDVQHNKNAPNTPVDSWPCNGTDAQKWQISDITITHNDDCLSVKNNTTSPGSPVVINECNNEPGQVWLRDHSGFYNPNSTLCLAVPNSQTGEQLELAGCSSLSEPNETWTGNIPTTCDGTEGQKVACYAIQDWTTWQTGQPSHETLLNSYTDGAPYEEWCADFVSYVYKQAGYPFTGGETDGWDENIAGNIQYIGFTEHDASSYSPQPGDVAYFDYGGGHVEIVVSGGPHPTFIYGDSAQIDPTTGNGDMKANTIVQDGSIGQVVYYLSPN